MAVYTYPSRTQRTTGDVHREAPEVYRRIDLISHPFRFSPYTEKVACANVNDDSDRVYAIDGDEFDPGCMHCMDMKPHTINEHNRLVAWHDALPPLSPHRRCNWGGEGFWKRES